MVFKYLKVIAVLDGAYGPGCKVESISVPSPFYDSESEAESIVADLEKKMVGKMLNEVPVLNTLGQYGWLLTSRDSANNVVTYLLAKADNNALI